MNFLNYQLLKLIQSATGPLREETQRAPTRAAARLYPFAETRRERSPCGAGAALLGPKFTLLRSALVRLLALPLGEERGVRAYLHTQIPGRAPRCRTLERAQSQLRLGAGVHQLHLTISPERAAHSEGYALMAFSAQ